MNELVQLATGVRERILKVERQTLPSFMGRREYNDDWFVATLDAVDIN